jgi:DNA-directed RNA polymerase subunit E'/Rpb7
MTTELSFTTEVIKDRVKLPCRYFGDGIRRVLLDRLRAKYEGRCSKYGYINANSVELRSVEKISIDMHSLRGNLNAELSFSAEVFNPLENSVMRGVVRNVNTAGVLVIVRNLERDVMSVIVPKRIAVIQSNIDLDTLQIGMKVQVKIVKRQVEVGQSTLYAIGTIVAGPGDPTPGVVDDDASGAHGLLADIEDESIIGDVDLESTASGDQVGGSDCASVIFFDEDDASSDGESFDEEECAEEEGVEAVHGGGASDEDPE